MKNLPKVSIIIPTYNRAKYLTKAIESALMQDYPNLEVIISDNNSTDETPEIVKKYFNDSRFKYFRNDENIGMVRNWRKSVFEYSTGDWFMILSDDDYLIDNSYVSKALKLASKDKDITLIYANGYILHEEKGILEKLELPFKEVEYGKEVFLTFHRGIVKPTDFTLCNVIFRKDLAKDVNAFFNEYNLACDSELVLKLFLLGKVGIVKDIVSVYRIHNSNVSNMTLTKDFLLGYFDAFISPYTFAKENNLLTEEELMFWFNETMLPVLIHTIIKTKTMKELILSSINSNLNFNKIAIYGAGALGLSFYENYLDSLSNKVCCFLDDEPKGREIVGKPIIRLQDAPKDIELIIISPIALSSYRKMKSKVYDKDVIWLRDIIFPALKSLINIDSIIGV